MSFSLRNLSPLLGAVLLVACSKGGPEQGGPGGMPPAPVTVLNAAMADVPINFEFTGQLAGSREVEIRARVTGVIEQRQYEEGSRVKAGQPLFRIERGQYAASAAQTAAAVAAAEARLKQAEREQKRLSSLLESKMTSQQDFDNASSARELAHADLLSARANHQLAQLNLGYSDVRAPISGVVGKALKVEGALVGPQDGLLTTMAQTDPIHAEFSLAESEQQRLRDGLKAGSLKLAEGGFKVRVKLSSGEFYGKLGKLDFQDFKVDSSTGSYAARASLPNAEHQLSPGQFVRVQLEGASRPGVIALPQRAVLDGPTGKFVYLAGKGQDGKPAAIQQPVVVGEWAQLGQENAWVIKQGLKAGDPVIVDGMARIFFPGQAILPSAPEQKVKVAQQLGKP